MFLKKRVLRHVKEALNGAKDIIAERISDEADYRIYIRNLTMRKTELLPPQPRIRKAAVCI